MKAKIFFTVAIIFLALRLDAKPAPEISIGLFYDSLRPYGEWIQLDANLTVWHPLNIHAGWRPYSVGRWYWSDQGWYWDSDEPFGWATYHYGRWYLDDYYGWIWIPDDQWGPAWVEWRYNDDYIGWAPLPPYASFHFDLGIRFSIGWHSNYGYWNFISYNHFNHHRLHDYILDSYRCERVFRSTRYRTNYYSDRDRIINGGIDRNFIERRGGYRISERRIRDVNNYNEYSRNKALEGDRSDRITAYRPSERNLGRDREVNREEIKRGEARSSLRSDRITMRNEGTASSHEYSSSRNFEYKNDRINKNEERGSVQRNERSRISERDNNYNQSWRDRSESNNEDRRVVREKAQNYERQQPNNSRQEYRQRNESQSRQPSYERQSRSSDRSSRSESSRSSRGSVERKR